MTTVELLTLYVVGVVLNFVISHIGFWLTFIAVITVVVGFEIRGFLTDDTPSPPFTYGPLIEAVAPREDDLGFRPRQLATRNPRSPIQRRRLCKRCKTRAPELQGGFCSDCHLAGLDAGYVLIEDQWQPLQSATKERT